MTMTGNEQSTRVAVPVQRGPGLLRVANIPLASVLLWYGFLLIIPLLLIVFVSFWPTIGHRPVPGFTLDNYTKLFETDIYLRTLLKTVLISLAVSIGCIAMAYPCAYCISKKVRKHKLRLLSLIIVPFWTSFLLRAYAGMVILGRQGLVNGTLLTLGIIDEPLEFLLFSTFSMSLGFIYIFIPFAILAIYSTMEGIDDSWLSAASDLGASWWQRLLYITFPLSLPGVVAAFLLLFLPIVGDYVIPRLIGGPSGTVLATLMVDRFGISVQWGFGAVLALLLAVVALATVWIAGKYVNLGRLLG